jgi:hypothetical protein
MIGHHRILYSMIVMYQESERLRRGDETFDAFEELSRKIGHKNSSTLRKMCEPRVEGSNAAKLGFLEANIIMDATQDYRLLQWQKEDLRVRKEQRADHSRQLHLFSVPCRTTGDIEP